MYNLLPILDPIVLLIGLLLTAYAVHKVRSRKMIVGLMAFGLIYFGIFRHGCVCSIGALQNVAYSFLGGPKVALTVSLLFFIPIIISLIWGRLFCATMCPLGAVQDFVNIISLKLPRWLNETLKMIPPIYLGATIIVLAVNGTFLICKVDPFLPIFRLGGRGILLWSLGAVIAISMIINRPYCRFLCPYGFILGLVSKYAPFALKNATHSCIDCTLCMGTCPVEAIEKVQPKKSTKKDIQVLKVYTILLPIWIVLFATVGYLFQIKISHSTEHFMVGVITGAFLGLYWGIKLIHLSQVNTNRTTAINSEDCVDCGRCFRHCPDLSIPTVEVQNERDI